MADQFLKDHKQETKKGAVLAFLRRRRLESFLFVVVLLMFMIKSCAMDAAKEHVPRWAPRSLTGPNSAGQGGVILEKSYEESRFAPLPGDKSARTTTSAWEQRGQPLGLDQASQAVATAGSSSIHPALAGSQERLPLAQSLSRSGAIYTGGAADQGPAQGRDPLGLIEKGDFPSEEAPVRGDQYPEVPQGLDGKELVEAMNDDGLMNELKAYAKHETWKSLEKAKDGDLPMPANANALKNSKVVVEILKTRRATDSALYCGGSCKVEKRIRNNRATFYGEKY